MDFKITFLTKKNKSFVKSCPRIKKKSFKNFMQSQREGTTKIIAKFTARFICVIKMERTIKNNIFNVIVYG